jgi:hypothetical protein
MLNFLFVDWSIDGISQTHGEKGVFVSTNQSHAELYTEGEEEDEGAGERSTLGDYITEHMGGSPTEDAGDEEPHYCFVTKMDDGNAMEVDALTDAIEIPEYFADETRFIQPPQRIFALGPTNTGSVHHMHGDAWFALVHGEKRFILYPNGGCVV